MKHLTIDLERYKKEEKKTTEWQELCKELTEHFKKNCYWIAWKYPLWKIREAFKTAQKEDKPFQYFLGILKNIK